MLRVKGKLYELGINGLDGGIEVMVEERLEEGKEKSRIWVGEKVNVKALERVGDR